MPKVFTMFWQPMWVLSARDGFPLRCVQYSADLARNVADLLSVKENGTLPKVSCMCFLFLIFKLMKVYSCTEFSFAAQQTIWGVELFAVRVLFHCRNLCMLFLRVLSIPVEDLAMPE